MCTDRNSTELNSSELDVVVGWWVLGLCWLYWWLRYCLVGVYLEAWGILSFVWAVWSSLDVGLSMLYYMLWGLALLRI